MKEDKKTKIIVRGSIYLILYLIIVFKEGFLGSLLLIWSVVGSMGLTIMNSILFTILIKKRYSLIKKKQVLIRLLLGYVIAIVPLVLLPSKALMFSLVFNGLVVALMFFALIVMWCLRLW